MEDICIEKGQKCWKYSKSAKVNHWTGELKKDEVDLIKEDLNKGVKI